ncbi:hypothetical protein C6P40_000666 [Pichia californica]|uniref:Cyclin N-terminal domain-containing protein n=1 Tax=Pichia californica TaxID=460514 RepID=A0A9P6WK89_9ASCO|nr:hypothetical protein C6P42_000750 [[Candida] californica]KAG0688695.1 hypothetical protein C6P40_000666 [[Candida] californica]
MLRRSSNRTQTQNNENTNQVSKSKPVVDSNPQRYTQSGSSIPNTALNTTSRTVLGIVPENALNSQNISQQSQFQSSQSESSSYKQQQQQQQQTQQLKTKIPVLVDTNQSHNSSIPKSDDILESTNITHYDQENFQSYSHDHGHDHDLDPHHHIHHEIDDDEDENADVDVDVDEDEDEDDVLADEEDDDLLYNEPLSPILNDSIRLEIDRVYTRFSRDTLDPNDEDTYDVTMVAEYGNRIFNYLHSLEIKYKPNARYIEEVQDDLLWEHRATLMDWLVQLHSRFNLLPETLYLAVNIIDRFLSKKTISLSRFQLCGAVALFLAAKYEEINVPTVSQMVYMVGNQYPRESFLRAERFMVEVLGFEFGWPGPMSFLRRGSKADDYDNEIRTLAKYFLEITIMDSRFVSSPPSWLAAGAQFLARRMLGRGDWTEAHIYYTGYTAEQLVPLAEVLEECCMSSETHHRTIFQKYSERRFKRSACYVQEYLHELYGTN